MKTRSPIPALVLSTLTSALLPLAATAQAHDAHVHGTGNMDVTIEGQQVTLQLTSPLANLAGFEHAPKTGAERTSISKMATTLRQPGMFVFPAAAACTNTSVVLKADHIAPALLGEKQATPAKHDHQHKDKHEHAHDGHGDLHATYVFDCAQPGQLSYMDSGLNAAFPSMATLKVQAVTPQRQLAATLTASDRRLQLK